MLKIEKMTESTAVFVAELESKCFHDPWDEKTLIKTLSNNSIIYLTAEEDGKIAGYVGFYDLVDEYSIINIAVDRAYRRKGVAKALLTALKEKAKEKPVDKITLEVRASNTSAVLLYENSGYVKIAEKENYYTKPKESAFFYRLEINNADTEL